MNRNELSKKLRHHITPNHLGLCVFSDQNFFETSPYALVVNYFLDWEHIPAENSDSNNMMFLPTLYHRTFPIIICKSGIDEKTISQKLQNLIKIVPGLTHGDQSNIVEVSSPKVLVVLDTKIYSDHYKTVQKATSGIKLPIHVEHLKSSEPLMLEVFSPSL